MTCGEVFENLEYDEEEVKELTESFVQETSHFETEYQRWKRPRESFD